MDRSETAFGAFLRNAIKESNLSQTQFYTAVGITKPYFYDILSGRVNPPPSDIQYRMLSNLRLSEEQRSEFLDLAAQGRGEIPADIAMLIMENTNQLAHIRVILRQMFK